MKGRGKNVRKWQRDAAAARIELETDYRDRLIDDSSFESLVTAKSSRDEPYHRWHRYRQGFAPELVRRFISESFPVAGPILDPFSGSGTVTTECARQGLDSIGLDALGSLAFLASSRRFGVAQPWLEGATQSDVRALLAKLVEPAHRAALLFAAASTVDGEGRGAGIASLDVARIREVLDAMNRDARVPLRATALNLQGDARRLPLRDDAVGGILTSPPYLSRYDYGRINSPIERLWQGNRPRSSRAQIRASTVRPPSRGESSSEAAVAEVVRELEASGHGEPAKLASAYFADMANVIRELARVARDGAPFWLNVAGAEVKRLYVPADLILARNAEESGFEVEEIRVARRFRESPRLLGDLEGIAPRESIVQLRRRR